MNTAPRVSRRFCDMLFKLRLWYVFVACFKLYARLVPPTKHITLDGINGGPRRPYLTRWHMIPRNRFFNVYLHAFLHGDDDRALHTHAWNAWSLILDGGYTEITGETHDYDTDDNEELFAKMHPDDGREFISRNYDEAANVEHFQYAQDFLAGDWRAMPKPHPHYLKLFGPSNDVPCMTLFITGPRRGRWYFKCPEGDRDFEEYLADHPTRPNATVGCE